MPYVNDAVENKVMGAVNTDKANGIVISVKDGRLVANETATLTLSDVYTLDYADETANGASTIGETLAKLTYGEDYTVQWQYLDNAGAYAEDYAAASWSDIGNANAIDAKVTAIQGRAYRAVITVTGSDPTLASYNQVTEPVAGRRTYYSNVLTAGDSNITLNISITTSNTGLGYEGIVEGETATIHTLMAGGSVTPISSVTVTVTPKGEEDTVVFTKTENNVNGNVRFDWNTAV
jgi:hypothetical protein